MSGGSENIVLAVRLRKAGAVVALAHRLPSSCSAALEVLRARPSVSTIIGSYTPITSSQCRHLESPVHLGASCTARCFPCQTRALHADKESMRALMTSTYCEHRLRRRAPHRCKPTIWRGQLPTAQLSALGAHRPSTQAGSGISTYHTGSHPAVDSRLSSLADERIVRGAVDSSPAGCGSGSDDGARPAGSAGPCPRDGAGDHRGALRGAGDLERPAHRARAVPDLGRGRRDAPGDRRSAARTGGARRADRASAAVAPRRCRSASVAATGFPPGTRRCAASWACRS